MEKIKVLMGIIRSNSGLSTYAVNLFRKMDKEAFDCTFLSNDPHPYFEQDIKDLGGHLEVIASRNRHPKQHLEDLRKIMRETKFDVCHIHLSSNSNICPIVEAKKAGIPIVIAHCHSTDVEGGGSFQRILHRINQKKLQKMDITRMACSKAAGKFAFGEAPFVVANNAIDVNQFDYSSDLREKMRDQLGLQNCFVVGQVGRLVPVKNHLYTLSLFQILQQKCPESRLLIVGDGALEQSLKQKTEEMGMQSKVLFVGSVRNPEAYFNAMDCMILPSLFEGFSLATVEAVCSGMHCFLSDSVTREAGISELVQFFPLQDMPEMTAEKLLAVRDLPRFSQKDPLTALGFNADEQIKLMEKRYRGQTAE